MDNKNYSTDIKIQENSSVQIYQNDKELYKWYFNIVKDFKPSIDFLSPPSATSRDALKVEYYAKDDYGIKNIKLIIQKPKGFLAMKKDNIEVDVPTPLDENKQNIKSTKYTNLSSHIWAGYKTNIVLEVEDALGQKSQSIVQARLPEKTFSNLLAKSVIDHRKSLALKKTTAEKFVVYLNKVKLNPSAYKNNTRVNEELDNTLSLFNNSQGDDYYLQKNIYEQLWILALAIEDSGLASAEIALRNSEEELSKSLKEKSNLEGINSMVSTMDEALSDYLEEMKQNNKYKEENNNLNSDESNLSKKMDIEDLMEDIKDLVGIGASEEAEKKMEQLKELTESMGDPGERRLGENGEMNQRQAFMQQISELIDEQELMMEESFHQASRQGYASQNSPGAGMKHTPEDQENLRKSLGEIMKEIGEVEREIPEELGRAERAMRQAVRELERGRMERASNAQGRAMEMMKRGSNELEKRMSGNDGAVAGGNERRNYESLNRDPLGRMVEGKGNTPGADVGISGKREILAAKEIISELYERASDEDRTNEEKGYIGRLLDWY